MGWLGCMGFCGALLAFILSFIPPSQISTGSNTVWFSVLVIGCIVVVGAPFLIYAARKPSWRNPQAQFEPFHWEQAAQTPANIAAANAARHERRRQTGRRPQIADGSYIRLYTPSDFRSAAHDRLSEHSRQSRVYRSDPPRSPASAGASDKTRFGSRLRWNAGVKQEIVTLPIDQFQKKTTL